MDSREPIVDLTPAIWAMKTSAESVEMERRIVEERPDQLDTLFSELLRRRATLLRSEGKIEQAEQDEWTANLWCSAFAASIGLDGFHVLADAGAKGGDPLAVWRTAPEGIFKKYWAQGHDQSLPPPLRALLQQGLWELRPLWQRLGLEGLPSPIDVLNSAIDTHTEAAIWIGDRGLEPLTKGMLEVKHWQTAARLAHEVGQPDHLKSHVDNLKRAQRALLDKAPQWALSLIEIEVGLAVSKGRRRDDLVTDERLEELLIFLDDVRSRLDQMGSMGYIEPEVIDTRITIERLLGRGPDQKEVARRKAEMMERQATRASSGIVASVHWKAAAAEFYQAGLREEGARATAAARAALRQADAEGEFHEVFVPINIKDEDQQKVIAPFFDGADTAETVLRRMTQRLFAPSLEFGSPKKQRSRSIVGQIAMTVPMVDDQSLKEISPGTQEQEIFEARKALVQEIVLCSGIVISELFAKLRSDHQLHSEDLFAAMAASPFVDIADLPFLRTATYRYMHGDRVSAMHVLVPRVEQMIRRILQATGTGITALRNGELRERPFGELLRAAEADGTMPTALVRLLQAVYSEDWGLNLRNRVAHGLATEADCSQANLDRVLHTALLLAAIRLVEQ